MIDLNVYSKLKMSEQFCFELREDWVVRIISFHKIDTGQFAMLLQARDPYFRQYVLVFSKGIDNVFGEIIGEISKSSGCIFKCRSDKRTVDKNKISRINYTFPKISQGVEPSAGFLDNIIAVNSP